VAARFREDRHERDDKELSGDERGSMRSKLARLTGMETRTVDTATVGKGGRPIAVLIQTFEAEFERVPDSATWAMKTSPGRKFGLRTYLTRDGKPFMHVTNQLLFESAGERDAEVEAFIARVPHHLDRLKAWL
jgi:hypothetical protein